MPIPTSTFDIIELADGRFIVNASTRTPNGIAKPLFLLNAKGDVIRGFGEEAGRPVLPSTRARSHFRRLLSIGPESFWAVEGAFRFRLVEWTSDGVRGVVLTGRVGWMPGKEVPYSPVTPDTPPQSVIAAVGAVNDSLAIVMAAVADPEWSRGLDIVPQPPSPGELHRVPASQQYRVARPAEAFDTQLEVLDVRRKTLVASSRVDAAIGYALNDGLVAGIEVGPSGEYSVRIYRVLVRAS